MSVAGNDELAADSDAGNAEPSAHRRSFAYVTGAFGLAFGAQANFLVPLRARELGAAFDVIGMIVAGGAVASLIVSVPSGALIDRYGPRRVFIFGTTAASSLSLLFLLATSYWWLLLLQPFVGVARSLAWVSSQAYVTAMASPHDAQRLAGRFGFFSSTGQMVGPVIVGVAATTIGLRWAFVVPAAYAAAFAVIGARLPEPSSAIASLRRAQGAGFRSAASLVVRRGVQAALLLTFARVWISVAFTAFFPLYLVELGTEPSLVGAIVATSGLMGALAAPTAAFWTRFVSNQTAAVVGLACSGASLVFVPLFDVPAIYLVPSLVGAGVGLSLPLLLTMMTSAVPADRRGVSLGLRGMANQVAAMTSPLLVGPLIGAIGMAAGFAASGGFAVAVVMTAAFARGRPSGGAASVVPHDPSAEARRDISRRA